MKKLLAIILMLAMVMSFATALPISAVENDAETIDAVGNDEPQPYIGDEPLDDESEEWFENLGEEDNEEDNPDGEEDVLPEDEVSIRLPGDSIDLEGITFSSHSNYSNVDYGSIKVSWLTVSGTTSFRVYGKILEGYPNPGDNEPGEMIYDKTTTSRYFTWSKSYLEPGKWIKVYVAAYNSSGFQIAGGELYLFVNEVVLDKPSFTSHKDRQTVKLGAKDEDFKVSWGKVTNAEGYRVVAKVLAGTPNPSDNERGTEIIRDNDAGRYVYIDKSDLRSGQWVKVWVEAYNKTLGIASNNSIYLYVVFDEAQTPSISLSESAAKISWNDTSKDYITVSTSDFTYEIEYPSSVVNSAGAYDYEWIECSKSGSKLYFKANRPNYFNGSRVVNVIVKSGGSSAVLKITQEKCGESAPTLKLKRGSTYIQDGSYIGSFVVPQEKMDVDVEANHIRKLVANLAKKGDNRTITSSSTLSMIRLDIGSLTAGEYQITVYASNSDFDDDYWAQRPFSSVKLYFTLTGGGSTSDDGMSYEEALKYFNFNSAISNWTAKYHCTAAEAREQILNGTSRDLIIRLATFARDKGRGERSISVINSFRPASYQEWICTHDYAGSFTWNTTKCKNTNQSLSFVEAYAEYLKCWGGSNSNCSKPGYSGHNSGDCMDVDDAWLKSVTNAQLSGYKLTKNVSSENWHFSITDGILATGGDSGFKRYEYALSKGREIVLIPCATSGAYMNKGASVAMVQKKLKSQGYSIDIDGLYSSNTASVVKRFQSDNGLKADGICGYNTLKKLFPEFYNSSSTSPHTHSFSGAWQSDANNHWQVCSCGEKGNIAAHTWDSGYTADGVKTYTCTVCQRTKTETVSDPQPTDAKIVVGKVSGVRGKEVLLPISFKNSPGITQVILELTYDDSILTLSEVTYDSNLGGQTVPPQIPTRSPIRLLWSDVNANKSGDFDFAVLKFSIAESAETGKATSINVKYIEAFNSDYTDVVFNVQSGSVNIVASHVPGDINGDGYANGKDIVQLMRYHAGWKNITVNEEALDVNGDGFKNGKDIVHLMRYHAGWNVTIY